MDGFSFAVLPLQNASNDPQQRYIAVALTDGVTGDLSHILNSSVVARASTAALAANAPGITAEAAASRLGVRYVLHGSAAVRDETIRVAAALFDAEPAKDLWAAEFTRPEAEISALRSALVARVAHSVGANLTDVAEPPISDPQAVDQLLQAQALLLEPQTPQIAAAAQRLLEAVLRRAPQNSEAMTGLASLHLAAVLAGSNPAPLKEFATAQHLVDAAIAADPHNARALTLRGALLRVESKPAAALAAYEAAAAADLNFAEAYAEIGRLKVDLGRAEEATPAIERALRLSPLDPQRSLWMSFAGMALLYAGQPAEAMPWLEKSAALNPGLLNPLVWLAAAYELQGEPAKARDAVKAALRLNPRLDVARIERQFADANQHSRQQLVRVIDALRRAGLPG